MTNTISQEKCCFLALYQAKENWIPTFKFVGEVILLETPKRQQEYVFLSYKAPVRLSDLFYNVEGIERRMVTGKSGARYYEYRFLHSKIQELPIGLINLI